MSGLEINCKRHSKFGMSLEFSSSYINYFGENRVVVGERSLEHEKMAAT